MSAINIAFFGSSLLSSYWNGAATYYRGILRALHDLGYRTTFFEPDAYGRQQHRDLDRAPTWADVHVYPNDADGVAHALGLARRADWIVKASGVGVFDDLLEREVLQCRAAGQATIFWDVDAPATLERLRQNPGDPFLKLIPDYDLIFTYGGGDFAVRGYRDFGAQMCIPIYNGLDPRTHHPVPPVRHFESDLSLLANRLPDREARVEEFFLRPAAKLKHRHFVLGGSGWADKPLAPNIRYLGHVPTADHNAFSCSAMAVLNVSRDSMAQCGFSPATRVFEAAGAGACIITDAWEGIDQFFAPSEEILVAESGDEVAEILEELTVERARQVGLAAYLKAIARHTYRERAQEVDRVLSGHLALPAR